MPIYGWSWSYGASGLDVLDIFEISINAFSKNEIKGVIVTTNHLLTGFEFTAWPRHKKNDGHYNCEMILVPDKKVHGYCQVKFNITTYLWLLFFASRKQ